MDCMTNLLGIGGAERELPGAKHVFSSVIDSTRGKGFGGNFCLQSINQLHVEPKGEGFVGGEDDYQISRVLSTQFVTKRDRHVPTERRKVNTI